MDLKIVNIFSARRWSAYFPQQVVYEWEDIIAKELSISIDEYSSMQINAISNHYIKCQFQKLIRRTFISNSIDSSFNYLKKKFPCKYFLTFFLYPLPVNNHFVYSDNILPILLDCFRDVIDEVPEYFKKSKILFVTNFEVFDYLKNTSLKERLVYLPLSISDVYVKATVPYKDIDVLQMGRQNPVLHNWMLKIAEENPEIEYVYSKLKEGTHNYYSTKKGWMGPLETRGDFMSFLSRAKVSLLSAPGIDGGEARTGGFNPVTPRFFESAVNYCYMMGRYPTQGADFKFCNIQDVCKHYEDFESFQQDILSMVSTTFDKTTSYSKFINQHLTSQRAAIIKQALLSL